MFLTEAEILDTPLSLNYTCQYFEKNKKKSGAVLPGKPAKEVYHFGLRLQLYAGEEHSISVCVAPGNQRKCDRRRRLHCGPSVLV